MDDPNTLAELKQLFDEQLEIFSSASGVIGAYFWTLRMGSGWDPRPTDGAPSGRQLEGSDIFHSLPGYQFPVWSLLEMAAMGVATPLNRSKGRAPQLCVGRGS